LGGDPGELAGDRAVARCAQEPIPLLSAAASATAARRAAAVGAGLLFDSLVTPARVRTLVDAYRTAGGTGPCVLVRRAWLGEPPREEVEHQVEVYRSYAPSGAPAHWGAAEMIAETTDDVLASRLVAVARDTGVDALNLRVHVPGVTIDAAREQIVALGNEVVPRVKRGLSS
ncbi:MAG: class flavin-dependent oxidoreductase, partial [Actinomycetia bacterium]|nr:class flavin-dependent oxidoreductase [Actinomycetes bacterium]